MADISLKKIALLFIGLLTTTFVYELAQAISALIRLDIPEMGVIYPVILMPILMVPLGIIGCIVNMLLILCCKLKFLPRHWLLSGCLYALINPALFIYHFITGWTIYL